MYALRLFVVAAIGSLAAGCCCPALSGRYYEVGMQPPQPATSPAPAAGDKQADPAAACSPESCPHSGRLGHRWLGREQKGAVPSQQQYDYVSPLPQFHPAPTRPVFESLPYYLPPLSPAAKPSGVAGGSPKAAAS